MSSRPPGTCARSAPASRRWPRWTRPSCSSPRRSCGHRSSWSARSPRSGKLPVVLFTAGGIATPADAAMMMQLGRRGRVRRLRHLQVRRPGPAGGRDRAGHHLPRRPRRDRQGQPRSGRGDGRASTWRRCRRPSGSRPAAGERAPHRGAGPPGRRPRAPGRAARAGCRGRDRAAARGTGRGRRPGPPRWRVHHHGQAGAPASTCSNRCAPPSAAACRCTARAPG